MPVTIADAVIPLLLDLTPFNEGIAQAEARIQALGAQAQAVAGQVAAAGASAQAAAAGAGGGGGGPTISSSGAAGGGGGGGVWDDIISSVSGADLTGFSTLPSSISRAMDPNSPGGRGWTLGEDIGATLRLLGVRGGGRNSLAGELGGAAVSAAGDALMSGQSIGDALSAGARKGINEGRGAINDAVRQSVADAIDAGKKEAEAESPSRRSAREIGGPIMQGVELAILTGAPAVAAAMMTSLGFAFNQWKAATFGGTFVGPGLNTVANPGGMLGGGLGGYLGQLGTAMQIGMIQANPTNLGEASRSLLGQFPMQARNWGQNLLSGALESALPGWAAGPLGDMVGTYFGLKPIITAQDALGASKSADAGGFADYPYGGGQFVFNNTFNGVGNFTDVEREVQLGILTSMRRLGAY